MGNTIGRAAFHTLLKIGSASYKIFTVPKMIKETKKLSGIANMNEYSLASLQTLFTQQGVAAAPTSTQVQNYHSAVQELVNCLNQFSGANEKTLTDALSKGAMGRDNDIPGAHLTTIRGIVTRYLGSTAASVANDFQTRIERPIEQFVQPLLSNVSPSVIGAIKMPKQLKSMVYVSAFATHIFMLL